MCFVFFFFKQKTAYEMRISDWSSDVCSSDLKDGAYRWAEGRMEPLRDQNGAIVQWYGINLDIDDEMRAQEALRDRERELSQLVDLVPSLLWRLTPDGEPNFFNKRLIDFFGLDIAAAAKPTKSRQLGGASCRERGGK